MKQEEDQIRLGGGKKAIERQHQKLIEESPSPVVTHAQRDEIGAVLKKALSTAGYTNAAAALGSPSRQTVDPDPTFGGTFPVDPFSPPYLSSQVVSIGAGGSLTVHLDTPVVNDPAHPFGVDFIIFGNSGFVITNGNFSGGGITDGSLFANNSGSTRVSVSLVAVVSLLLHCRLRCQGGHIG